MLRELMTRRLGRYLLCSGEYEFRMDRVLRTTCWRSDQTVKEQNRRQSETGRHCPTLDMRPSPERCRSYLPPFHAEIGQVVQPDYRVDHPRPAYAPDVCIEAAVPSVIQHLYETLDKPSPGICL